LHLAIAALLVGTADGQESVRPVTGFTAQAQVSAATRLDWIFSIANQSPAQIPDGLLDNYDSSRQTYQRFVPENYRDDKAWPVVLYISAGKRGSGWDVWKSVCQRHGVLFVGPHNAGNNCPGPRRARIVLDALDDMRRNYRTDPDRTYITGFSGGGRVACQMAFALPELFGGVVPLCAAGELRSESWLRQRVIDRLSVALVTGEKDFNRSEVERFRGPLLSEVGVRTRVWVVPRLGHRPAGPQTLEQVFQWLETATAARRKLAQQHAASRIDGQAAPTRMQTAQALLDEARNRMKSPAGLYAGLMIMKGIMARWPDLAAARNARATLLEMEQRPERPWEAADIAEQRRFLIARARGLDAYATGPLPQQYQAQRPEMLDAAIQLWNVVLRDAQDKQATQQARRRLPLLKQQRQSLKSKSNQSNQDQCIARPN
jgi:pimeloyl-ACP methyl ester carboxylesterase